MSDTLTWEELESFEHTAQQILTQCGDVPAGMVVSLQLSIPGDWLQMLPAVMAMARQYRTGEDNRD